LFVIAVVLQITLSRALLQAQTKSRFELEWHVPQGCLDHDAARTAIENALGSGGSARTAPAVVRVTIEEVGSERWTADIWMYDAAGSGERSVEGTSCEQVAQATALIVALALSADPATAAPQTQPSPPPAQAATPDAATPLGFAAGARLVADFGSLPLPRPDLGFALVLGLQYRSVRAEAEGAAWLPRIAPEGLAANSVGSVFLYRGALRGCIDLVRTADGRFDLGPCAAAEAGATFGRGVDLTIKRTKNVFWAAGLLGLSARYLGAAPLWVGLLVELGLPLHRPAWQVDDSTTVFQAAPVIGRLAIGVGWLFP